MTVQDLRDTLTKLVELLEATDAKAATTNGLTEFVEATANFGNLKLKEFVKLAEKGRTPIARAVLFKAISGFDPFFKSFRTQNK